MYEGKTYKCHLCDKKYTNNKNRKKAFNKHPWGLERLGDYLKFTYVKNDESSSEEPIKNKDSKEIKLNIHDSVANQQLLFHWSSFRLKIVKLTILGCENLKLSQKWSVKLLNKTFAIYHQILKWQIMFWAKSNQVTNDQLERCRDGRGYGNFQGGSTNEERTFPVAPMKVPG